MKGRTCVDVYITTINQFQPEDLPGNSYSNFLNLMCRVEKLSGKLLHKSKKESSSHDTSCCSIL